MTGARIWARALDCTRRSANFTLPALIDQRAVTHGPRPALIDEADTVTYDALVRRVNRYARWALTQGIAGKTVALLMHNGADYVATWLGLTRVGCEVALLNTNLRHDAMRHCIAISGASHLIGRDLLALTDGVPVEKIRWPPDDSGTSDPIDSPHPAPQDVALLIYTSGTTGLPKAAKVTHRRITEWSSWFAGMTDAHPDDRLYDCLPMYHSVGGIVAVGSMLVSGASVVVRRHFSATRFWDDLVQSRCTIFQYIGELCRYLISTPPNPIERGHQLRLAVGNGLQADVWRTFQARFAIPKILEYYAATEGALSLYNCDGEPGAIGRIPPMLEPYFAVELIKVDPETTEPIRDAAGFCIVAGCDEPGEAIASIQPNRPFDGYNDAAASQRKILENVLTPGDRWYRSGDLMRKDRRGFYYFVDRLGDTFRRKGENVSTTEVANIIRACAGVAEAVVYGVKVRGEDGRVGMAAIATTSDFTIEGLSAHLREHLPSYARPMFVRLCASLEATATFKLTKARLAAEGFAEASDPVYVQRGDALVRTGQ